MRLLSWLSCEDYTKRVSKGLDGPLGFWDKLCFWFHHFLCMNCRHFRGQVLFLDRALSFLRARLESEAVEGDERNCLSKESASRIQAEINSLGFSK